MHIQMVCWGNICRSPMAERVAQKVAGDRGLQVRIDSSGISSEEVGNPMDSRARATLEQHGYDASGHRAHQVDASDIADVDLFVAAEQAHADRLVAMGAESDRVRLVSDFDPEAEPGEPLPDPWWGDDDGFETTLAVLERAMPTLLDEVTGG